MELILNENNFEEKLNANDLPLLVDFWAEWCGPCQIMGPIITEIAEEYDGRVKVAKVNVDENPNLAGQFGIIGIPTLILFVNGKEFKRVVGVVPKDELKQLLDEQIKGV